MGNLTVETLNRGGHLTIFFVKVKCPGGCPGRGEMGALGIDCTLVCGVLSDIKTLHVTYEY